MKRRARNLSDQDIAVIVGVLDGWSGPLTWDALLERLEGIFGFRYTRQALFKHSRVQLAFGVRKKATRDAEGPKRSREKQMLLDRLSRLKAENERLARENDQLLEQFARWAFNAYTHGLGPEELNRSLPPIDRR